MPNWNLAPPPPSSLGDSDLKQKGYHLSEKNIALLISGSIAAYRTPDLIRSLRKEGANIHVFATPSALRYVTLETLQWCSQNPVITELSPHAEHLSENMDIDAYLVAPASCNLINKMAHGIADSLVTTALATALGKWEQQSTPVLIAPAMHGWMHNSILTRSLQQLREKGLHIIAPLQEDGKNKLATEKLLLASTIRAVSATSLKAKHLLITGGPIPVHWDSIRRLTNCFTGQLAIHLATESWYQGAKVHLILGEGSAPAPDFLSATIVPDYSAYNEALNQILENNPVQSAIFTAAVADYQPEHYVSGKIESGQNPLLLKLIPTSKVIDSIHSRFPHLHRVTFKYEENAEEAELLQIAQERLNASKNQMVVANSGQISREQGEQTAWLLEESKPPFRVSGKQNIAQAILYALKIQLKL